MNRRHKLALLGATGLVGVLGLTGCSAATEEWNDAPIEKKHDGPAEVFSMPDGFANVASKCDGHGHRIYTTRVGPGGGKDVAVVADDACPKG